MLNKLVKEAVVLVVGKQAGDIVDFLDNKKYINEFLIAKKMDITVNQVRNILYRLSDNGLVSSTRKKDKKKGWYTYFWKVESLKTLEFLKRILVKRIEQISFQIKSRETKNFYICERCNIEFNEETSLLYDFTCKECGGVFNMKDNKKVLNEFNKSLDKLKKKLDNVEEEVGIEKAIIEKKKQRELAKEAKEKQKKRALKKIETALKRKATMDKKKKDAKKAIKKKVVKKSKKKVTKKKKVVKKKKISKVKPKKKVVKKSKKKIGKKK